jgi:hypothetical protein
MLTLLAMAALVVGIAGVFRAKGTAGWTIAWLLIIGGLVFAYLAATA